MQQLSNNYKHPSRIHPKFIRNSSKNHPKIIKNPSQIHQKSMKNRGCVADAFLEGLWAPKAHNIQVSPDHFGSHFPSKIYQMASNGVQGSPNEAKSRKKGRVKIEAKNDAETDEKMMPKGT